MSLSDCLQDSRLEASEDSLVDVVAVRDHQVRLLEVVATPLDMMIQAAGSEGIRLGAVSGFRSVERQTRIWDRKFDKARVQLDQEDQALSKVLEFSAPPGWSRHHWGTDVDLVGGDLLEDARLEPEDWEEGGLCYSAGKWLEVNGAAYGFLRPYDRYRGGFLAEPWHWSFVVTAAPIMNRIQGVDWSKALKMATFTGAGLVCDNLDELFPRFVLGVNPRLR